MGAGVKRLPGVVGRRVSSEIMGWAQVGFRPHRPRALVAIISKQLTSEGAFPT